MNPEVIANHCEVAVAQRLDNFTTLSLRRFTPSVRPATRYIGIVHEDGRQFLVEINITEATQDDTH